MAYKRKKYFERPGMRRRGILRIIFWLALLIFFGTMIYIFFFSGYLKVTSINVSAERYISKDEIYQNIQSGLSGKIFGIIDRNNLLLANKRKIRDGLLRDFRQARNISVKKRFPHILEVSVTERIPTALFQSAGETFILDENAVAYDSFDLGSSEKGGYDLPILSDSDGKRVDLGKQVLSQDYLEYIKNIKVKTKDRTGIETESSFTTPSLISHDIRVRTKEGWQIFFNENINIDKEMEMLAAVLKSQIKEGNRPDLEYVDLRIDNKVYYKFRDGTPEEEARLAQEEAEKAAQEVENQPEQTNAAKEKKDKKK